MFKVLLAGFLIFGSFSIAIPTSVYAISLDDEEEDSEDVADLLREAKDASKSESFNKAESLLKKAKMYGVMNEEVKEAEKFVTKRKKAYYARLERKRKERERLARLEKEREERARRARMAIQNASSYGRGAITICYPNIPRPIDYSECNSAKTASGKYATVKLSRGGGMSSSNCFDLNIYANGSIAVGNTCGGANGNWSVNVNGQSGFANGLRNAIAWLLQRM